MRKSRYLFVVIALLFGKIILANNKLNPCHQKIKELCGKKSQKECILVLKDKKFIPKNNECMISYFASSSVTREDITKCYKEVSVLCKGINTKECYPRIKHKLSYKCRNKKIANAIGPKTKGLDKDIASNKCIKRTNHNCKLADFSKLDVNKIKKAMKSYKECLTKNISIDTKCLNK